MNSLPLEPTTKHIVNGLIGPNSNLGIHFVFELRIRPDINEQENISLDIHFLKFKEKLLVCVDKFSNKAFNCVTTYKWELLTIKDNWSQQLDNFLTNVIKEIMSMQLNSKYSVHFNNKDLLFDVDHYKFAYSLESVNMVAAGQLVKVRYDKVKRLINPGQYESLGIAHA